MLDFMKKFNVKKGFVITEDREEETEKKWFNAKKKINYIPLWKWLLD